MLRYVRLVATGAVLSGAVLVEAACGGSNEEFTAAPAAAPVTATAAAGAGTPTPSVIEIVGGVPPLWDFESLRTVVEATGTVVVGYVEKVAETRYYVDEYPYAPGYTSRTPYTLFDVRVERVINGNMAEGSHIVVSQGGGLMPDGRLFLFENSPLMTVGETYLLLLEDITELVGENRYVSASFYRFRLDPAGRIIPNGWDKYPGIGAVSLGGGADALYYAAYNDAINSDNPEAALEALARIPLDEAVGRIKAAIAEGPLPPRRTPEVAVTPRPSGTPQAAPATEGPG